METDQPWTKVRETNSAESNVSECLFSVYVSRTHIDYHLSDAFSVQNGL
jgi:hypothetical protein